MAFDLDAQRSGRIPGFGMIEGGYFDFSSGSATVDVATRMSKAVMGFGIVKTNDPDYHGLVATTDGDITNGNITFRRTAPYLAQDMRVYYMLTGW